MLIGNRIKKLRLEKNLLQEELGGLIGVTKVSVCGYENGTRIPSLEVLTKLADKLEVTPNYLFGHDYIVKASDDYETRMAMSEEDLKVIGEIKKFPKLYKKLSNNTKDTIMEISEKIENFKKY